MIIKRQIIIPLLLMTFVFMGVACSETSVSGSRSNPQNVSVATTRPAEAEPSKPIDGISVSVGDKTVAAEKGSVIKFKVKEKNTENPYVNKENESAEGTGVGAESSASEIASKINSTAPNVGLNSRGQGGDAVGGALAWDLTLRGQSQGQLALYVIGALLVVAGAVLGWLSKSWKIGVGLGAVGVGLITCGVLATTYPWVFLVAFFLVLGAGGVVAYKVYDGYNNKKKAETLEDVVTRIVHSIADAPKAAADLIKKEIKYNDQDKAVDSVVRKIKTENNIVNNNE